MIDPMTGDFACGQSGPLMASDGLDMLMPMHVWADASGHILHVGPTLEKLCAGDTLQGKRLLEVFELRRPRGVQMMQDLIDKGQLRVKVALRDHGRLALKGLAVALPRQQGVLLNLSFGISVVDAVRRYALKAKDFAPSDPTVEMLYLIEAQAAVLQESRNLNDRLYDARLSAEMQASTDTLTGLKNRRALESILARAVRAPSRTPFGLMHIDLDYFKSVNDTFGHAAGDQVLQVAAQIFTEEIRAGDIAARIGGDEFVLVLMGCDDRDKLDRVAARIIERLEIPISFNGAKCRVSASIGITLSSFYHDLSIDQISSDADAALYQSKNRGRSRHTIFNPTKKPRQATQYLS